MQSSMQGREEYANMMLEHTSVGIAVYDPTDLRLLQANACYLRMLEPFITQEWRGGRVLGRSFHLWGKSDARARMVAFFERCVALGQTQHVQELEFVDLLQEHSYWSSTLEPVKNQYGQVTHMVQTLSDMTAQVQARKATEQAKREISDLHREHKRLSAILDQLPEGIIIAERVTGTISYANQAASDILGIPLEQLVAVPLHRHRWSRNTYILNSATSTTTDGLPVLPWNFLVVRALSGEDLRGKETLVIQPDGTQVVTLASSASLHGENGLMLSSVIVLQDITAQKSLEQHKNDFLSVANHELRTPITVIQGFAEILQLHAAQADLLDDMTKQALANITEQSEHLTSLIEKMLDISRIEQDHFALRYAPCDLHELVARAVQNQAITTREHHLCLVVEGLPPDNALPACLDAERILQVMQNLLSNAIKYSPGGGSIEIGLRYSPERGHEAHVWVKDEGLGIASEALPHIFKRFYRANNLDRSLSGFGIGLYLVKEVVVRHGGHIWVESSKGHGAAFHITLPLNPGYLK